MAEQDSNTPANGAAPAQSGSGQAPGGAQAAILAQYIKDLSVESPSAPQVFQWQEQPRLEVQFNIGVERVADDVHEVAIKLEIQARSDQGVHFLIELTYGGLFGLRGMQEEALTPFLLIEAPRLLFPFARQIIAESTQNLGFPPLLLDPIDFNAAFVQQMQAQQQQNGASTGEQSPSEGEQNTAS